MCPNQKWLIKQICSTSDNIVIYQFHQRQHHPTTPTEQPPSFVFSIKTLLSFVAITFSVLQSIRFCLFNHWSFIILSPWLCLSFICLLLWLCLSFLYSSSMTFSIFFLYLFSLTLFVFFLYSFFKTLSIFFSILFL